MILPNIFRLHSSIRSLESDDVDFYFYFDSEIDGERLMLFLERKGFEIVCFEPSGCPGKSKWVLIVSKKILEDSLFQICKEFDSYAKKFNGKYDGYEREL